MNVTPTMSEDRRLIEYATVPWEKMQPGPERGWFMTGRKIYLKAIISFGEAELRRLLGKLELIHH